MPSRYIIDDMRFYARQLGGKCLSKEYIDTETPLAWMCNYGHTWDATFSIIRQGGWCIQCARGAVKEERLKELQGIAEKRGGKCLSKEYFTATTKLKFQCKQGHVWLTTPSSIKCNHWCPQCGHKENGERQKADISEFIKLAKLRGGKLITKRYVNSHTKMKWQCSEGHVWLSAAVVIKNHNHWCPKCASIRNGLKLRSDLNELKKLINKGGGQFLERKFINGKGLLFIKCKNGHTWKTYPSRLRKGAECSRCNGFGWLKIDYLKEVAIQRGGKCISNAYLNKGEKLTWQCANGHQWKTTPTKILQGSWCHQCGGTSKLNMATMHQRAKAHGGKCLSTIYVNNAIKLKWQCSKGHQWMAKPNDIQTGYWCPICGQQRRVEKRRLNISEFISLAKSRRGKLLSLKYVNANTKLKWQCEKGHQWMSKPSSIKNIGTWCPVCSGNISSPNIIWSSIKRSHKTLHQ